MNATDLIGWFSSFVLVLTLSKQIYKQVKERTSEGVSKWLYLGQFIAEIGFIIYSYQLRSWVFVFTNSALLIENVIGLLLVLKYRREKQLATGHSASG